MHHHFSSFHATMGCEYSSHCRAKGRAGSLASLNFLGLTGTLSLHTRLCIDTYTCYSSPCITILHLRRAEPHRSLGYEAPRDLIPDDFTPPEPSSVGWSK